MIAKEVSVNGSTYTFTLTDQVIGQVDRLKALYAYAYEDPEEFEQISAEISDIISNISEAIEPRASDGDMNDIIQEIIATVDNRKAEVEKQLTKKKR